MDEQKMRDLVMYWQQVELDDEAAKRLANQSIGAGKALREELLSALTAALGDGLSEEAAAACVRQLHRLRDCSVPRDEVQRGERSRPGAALAAVPGDAAAPVDGR